MEKIVKPLRESEAHCTYVLFLLKSKVELEIIDSVLGTWLICGNVVGEGGEGWKVSVLSFPNSSSLSQILDQGRVHFTLTPESSSNLLPSPPA